MLSSRKMSTYLFIEKDMDRYHNNKTDRYTKYTNKVWEMNLLSTCICKWFIQEKTFNDDTVSTIKMKCTISDT